MYHLIILILFVGGPASALALPPAVIEKSWERFFVALLQSFFGILLPLAFFFLSCFLSPDSKPLCKNGWIDCFAIGKLALAPFVFLASAALYAIEIYRVADRTRPWIVRGLIFGASISSVCVLFGFVTYGIGNGTWVLMMIPCSTAIWYIFRAAQAINSEKVKPSQLFTTLASSLPFWAASVFWSYKTYLSLPDQSPPDCFVVTAASRGHPNFVGPFLEVPHSGRMRLANQQLATLWQFEKLWSCAAPRSHAAFRRGYNIVGPLIARQIRSPWLADAVYLALKPVEFAGRLLTNLAALRCRLIESQPGR